MDKSTLVITLFGTGILGFIVFSAMHIVPYVYCRLSQSLTRGGDPESEVQGQRSADAKPSSETVAYVGDIKAACGNAPADFVLKMLLDGMSRDEARAAYINMLETKT